MKFERRVVLVNQYDEILYELETVDGYFYRIPKEMSAVGLMDVGDVYTVKEIEVEVE